MKRIFSAAPLLLLVLLTGCSLGAITPVAPPPPSAQAQEVTEAQVGTLQKIGNISAHVRGSPQDAEDRLQQLATQQGAHYYRIVSNTDTIIPGQWYAHAVVYR